LDVAPMAYAEHLYHPVHGSRSIRWWCPCGLPARTRQRTRLHFPV